MNDDKADDKPVEELSQAEQNALDSISDVKGGLIDNEEALVVEENDEPAEEDSEDGGEHPSKTGDESSASETPDTDRVDEEPTKTELTPEKDPEGVYEDKKAENPGDFKPGDYSFEIKTTDGKTHKFSAPEDLDAFAATLDDEPESISASQFSVFNRKAALMEQGIASDRKEFEVNKAEFDRQQTLNETRETHLKQWNSEINYLSKEGKLPEISSENNKADWSDPEVAKDPAVSARLELLKWMTDNNDKRIEAGLEPMSSLVDAYNTRRLEEFESQNDEKKKTDTSKRREQGNRVGGNAPYSPEANPKGGIVGKGGSLSDLVTEFQRENQ